VDAGGVSAPAVVNVKLKGGGGVTVVRGVCSCARTAWPIATLSTTHLTQTLATHYPARVCAAKSRLLTTLAIARPYRYLNVDHRPYLLFLMPLT